MNGEQKNYDCSKENSLCSMIGDFYNRKMLSIIILVWTWGIIIIALAVWSAVNFFKAEQTKDQCRLI